MITKKQLKKTLHGHDFVGVLSLKQAQDFAADNNFVFTFADKENSVFFYADNGVFGMDVLPERFVCEIEEFELDISKHPETSLANRRKEKYDNYKLLLTQDEVIDEVNKTHRTPVKWNAGHFPVGTVGLAKLHFNNEPFQFTVVGLVNNGVDSYVIQTDTPNDGKGACDPGEFSSFNISWVTAILKHGDGPLKIMDSKGTFNEFFRKDQARNAGAFGIKRHKSQYLVFGNRRALVTYVTMKYANTDMCVSIDKMSRLLEEQGVLRDKFPENCYYYTYVQVNKKKLNSAVKRLINKCLTPKKIAKAAEEAMYESWHNTDNYGENDLASVADFAMDQVNKLEGIGLLDLDKPPELSGISMDGFRVTPIEDSDYVFSDEIAVAEMDNPPVTEDGIIINEGGQQ